MRYALFSFLSSTLTPSPLFFNPVFHKLTNYLLKLRQSTYVQEFYPYLCSCDSCFKVLDVNLLSFWVSIFARDPHALRGFFEEFSISSMVERTFDNCIIVLGLWGLSVTWMVQCTHQHLMLWNFKVLANVRTIPKYSLTRMRSNS